MAGVVESACISDDIPFDTTGVGTVRKYDGFFYFVLGFILVVVWRISLPLFVCHSKKHKIILVRAAYSNSSTITSISVTGLAYTVI